MHGKFSDGSEIVMKLPREPVRFSRFERVGLRIKAVMVAIAIDAPTTLKRPNGDVYEGVTRFPDCEAHRIDGRTRLADAVVTETLLRLRAKK